MDAERFDTLIRSLLARPGRRGMLLGVSSGLLAALPHALGGDEAAAKKHKKPKHKKGKNPQTPVTPPPTCTDGIRNGSETDIDCGGPACPSCAIGQTCARNTDCGTARCGNARGRGTTCQSCTDDGVCGRDDNGTCMCDIDTGLCLSDVGPLPVQESCAPCPPRTVCQSSFDGFFCLPLCGA